MSFLYNFKGFLCLYFSFLYKIYFFIQDLIKDKRKVEQLWTGESEMFLNRKGNIF